MSWTGRQLDSVTKDGVTTTYEYDSSGMRTSKTVGSTTYAYLYYGGQLVRYTVANEGYLYFHYDDNGTPLGFTYDGVNGTAYFYYVLNLQGDIVQVRDSSRSVYANYSYDAWGKLLSITDAQGNEITDEEHVAVLNPLRYRGYVYDSETGFYYLNSRYYDPEVKRFINADTTDVLGADGSSLSYNLFAYCMNDPINRTDDGGCFSWKNIVKVAVGAVAIAGLAAATVCTGGAVGVAVGAALTGAISGGVSGAVSGAITGGISNGLQGAIDGACSGFMSGTLIGGVSGFAASGISSVTGAVKVVGSAQKTGTLLHRAASNIEAGKMSMQVWKYSKVTLNRSLNTAGLSGRRIPDVIGIARNGTSKLIEVVSKSQTVAQMTNKCVSMTAANPGATYKVIGWAAKVSRWR